MALSPDPIDVEVGRNMKARRLAIGMTLSGLARAIGVTYQQVNKYELGANRLSSSAIWKACQSLDISPNDLFSGVEKIHPLGAASAKFDEEHRAD